MKTVDRDLLEVAIRSIDDSCNHSDETSFADLKRMVIEAARAHLETLPKTVWRVTGVLPGGDRAAPYEVSNRGEAITFARNYLEQGVFQVSVAQVYP